MPPMPATKIETGVHIELKRLVLTPHARKHRPEKKASLAKSIKELNNPIEEAEGFKALNQLDSVYWTHDEIALAAGKDRTYVTKTISLLNLPENLQMDVRRRTL